MRTRIKYSQNFLRNKHLVERLIANSGIASSDTVYEIGAGEGIITETLSSRAGKTIAFEIDINLFNKLSAKFKTNNSVQLIHGDFLAHRLPTHPYKVFSNIPFNITAAIIKKLTLEFHAPGDAYLIVQKEAAKKFAGKPLDTKNSQMAALIFPWFELSITHKFQKEDFFPKPNVDIVLLQIKKRPAPLIENSYQNNYRDFVTYAFNQFKPNIHEGLSNIFGAHNSLPRAKPSNLELEQWLGIFQSFLKLDGHAKLLIKGAFKRQEALQSKLSKVHRTRVDKNWRSYKVNKK